MKSGLTLAGAHAWLFWFAASMTSATVLFFMFARAVGFPLEPHQATCLLQIALPVFMGYVFQLTRFGLSDRYSRDTESEIPLRPLTAKIVWVPPILATGILVTALALFRWSNQALAPVGSGMTYEDLALCVTIALALLAGTTTPAIQRLTS